MELSACSLVVARLRRDRV